MLTKILAIFGVAGLMVLGYALGVANTEPSDELITPEEMERISGQAFDKGFKEGRREGKKRGEAVGFGEGQGYALAWQDFSPGIPYAVDFRNGPSGPRIVRWTKMKDDFFYRCLSHRASCETLSAYRGE